MNPPTHGGALADPAHLRDNGPITEPIVLPTLLEFDPPNPITPPTAADLPESAGAGAHGAPSAPSGTSITPGVINDLTGLLGVPQRNPEQEFAAPGELMRVSVRTPSGVIDLAVSDATTVAELLITLLDAAPMAVREMAVGNGGWLLTAADGRRLTVDHTLARLGILDGAVLGMAGEYDTARETLYDDVADAVADTVRDTVTAWGTPATRRTALSATAALLVLGVITVLRTGPAWNTGILTLGGLIVALLVAGGLLSRGLGQTSSAVVLGLGACGYAFVGGTLVMGPGLQLTEFGPAEYLVGAAATVLVAAVGILTIGGRTVPLAAVVTSGLLAVIGLGAGSYWELSQPRIAAVTLLAALILFPLVASIAFRLARFELEPLPTTVEEVQEDEATVDRLSVAARTRNAVGFVSALVQGLSLVSLISFVLLTIHGGVWALSLIAVSAVALMIRSRLFIGSAQRLPLLVAGMSAIGLLILRSLAEHPGTSGLLWGGLPVLLLIVIGVGIAGRTKRMSPVSTRTAEILEVLLGIAVMPLTAGVLGLFSLFYGLGG